MLLAASGLTGFGSKGHLACRSPRSNRQTPSHPPRLHTDSPSRPRASQSPSAVRDPSGLPRRSLNSSGDPKLPKAQSLTGGRWGNGGQSRRPVHSACMQLCHRRPRCSATKAHKVCPWSRVARQIVKFVFPGDCSLRALAACHCCSFFSGLFWARTVWGW